MRQGVVVLGASSLGVHPDDLGGYESSPRHCYLWPLSFFLFNSHKAAGPLAGCSPGTVLCWAAFPYRLVGKFWGLIACPGPAEPGWASESLRKV